MVLGLAEILRAAAHLKTKEEKVAFLKKHDSIPLRRILRYIFDSRIEWILPKDWQPTWKPLPSDQHENMQHMLIKEARTCYLFLKGDDDWNGGVSMEKRQKMYIELLENCLPEDSELLESARKRVCPYPKITKELIQEVFPGLVI